MYEMHAGQCLERGPTKTGGLYMLGQEGWYDFFAQSVNQDNEGYCDSTTVGFKHVACRDDGRETAYKPNVANINRQPGWKPTKSNTQKSSLMVIPTDKYDQRVPRRPHSPTTSSTGKRTLGRSEAVLPPGVSPSWTARIAGGEGSRPVGKIEELRGIGRG